MALSSDCFETRLSMSGSSQQHDEQTGLETGGQAIRLGREARSITRDDLANRLHMGCEQLEALENGELHRLPEPVFVKAMVRRLGGHLRLDADALVDALGDLSQPAAGTPRTPPFHGPSASSSGFLQSKSFLTGMGVLLTVLVVGSALLLVQRSPSPIPMSQDEPASKTQSVPLGLPQP